MTAYFVRLYTSVHSDQTYDFRQMYRSDRGRYPLSLKKYVFCIATDQSMFLSDQNEQEALLMYVGKSQEHLSEYNPQMMVINAYLPAHQNPQQGHGNLVVET